MTALINEIRQLKRPSLLARAAQHGAPRYRRAVHLPRLIGEEAEANTETILRLLLDREQEVNAQRKAGAAEYRAARHVELLIALTAETAALENELAADQEKTPQVKASGIEAFFSATYAANASAMAGSMPGC